MKRENLLFIIVVILVVGLGICLKMLLEVKAENRETLAEAQRAADYVEIQNTFAKHSYYYAAQKQWLELETVWSKKRDDISYGHNNGYYMGRESVENYYGRKNETRRKQTLEMMSKLYLEVENIEENEGIGDLVMHTLTTPIVEVAKDRKTAQGVWMSVGLAARDGQDGKPDYVEFWERFAVDFVREDGTWKIWHFQIHSDVMINLPESMVGEPGTAPRFLQVPTAASTGAQPPQGPAEVPPNGGQVRTMKNDMDHQVKMHEMYSSTTVPQLSPRLPTPYDTWEDTTPCIE